MKKILLTMLASCALVACGGGGGNPGTPGNGTGGTTPDVASVEFLLDKTVIANSGSDAATITVTALSARDRKSTRLNSSHLVISYAVFCLKKKKKNKNTTSDSYKSTYITS